MIAQHPIAESESLGGRERAIRFSLLDLFVLMTISTIVACGTYQVHRSMVEGWQTTWRDMASASFAADREALIRYYSPALSLLYVTAAACAWYSIRGCPGPGSFAGAVGFLFPLLTAPLFPTLPASLIPGYPFLLLPLCISLYCFVQGRIGRSYAVAALTMVWFGLASIYASDWRAVFGE